MIREPDASAFDGFESTLGAATSADGRGVRGEPDFGSPIAKLADGRKLRFDGEFYNLPNTREGQRLALLITGERPKQAGAWISIHARQYHTGIQSLLSILSAMSEAATPALPANYLDNRNALIAAGVRGTPVETLARDPWVTPEIIAATIKDLMSHNRPDNVVAVLISNLSLHIPPPGIFIDAQYVTVTARRGDEVRVIADNRMGTVESIMHDGKIAVLMEDNWEIDYYDSDQIIVTEIAKRAG
jgi:hypothetical protein